VKSLLKKQNGPQVLLPIKHLTARKERTFRAKLLQRYGRIALLQPDRQFVIQLVKFAPGKGPQDWLKYYEELDRRLRKRYGMTRHQMDFHEIITFATWGRYDMVAIWDANDLGTVNKVLAESINPANPYSCGTFETLIVPAMIRAP